MSRSQFHSIKLFILRHAWLNLWDKHMTTGRINQVTLLSTHGHENHPHKNLRLSSGFSRSACAHTTEHAHQPELQRRALILRVSKTEVKFQTAKGLVDSLVLSTFTTLLTVQSKWRIDRSRNAAFLRGVFGVDKARHSLCSISEGIERERNPDLQTSLSVCLPIGLAYKLFFLLIQLEMNA